MAAIYPTVTHVYTRDVPDWEKNQQLPRDFVGGRRGGGKSAMLNDLDEHRIVDPVTGGEKGQKIDRYDLIPPEFEEALAVHYGRGAKKYADRNWQKGYAWGLSYRAFRSHLNHWQQGERDDPETGTHHLVCAIWHLISLYIYDVRGLGTDDIRRVS